MTGSRKTAANMTWYELMGQQIFKKIREAGQSNPSPQFLQAQGTSAGIWEVYRQAAASVSLGWTIKEAKQGRAQAFYKWVYKYALDIASAPSPRPVIMDETLLVMHGVMAPTVISSGSYSAATDIITLNFPTSTMGYGQRDDDVLVVFVKNAATGETFSLLTSATRMDGTWSYDTDHNFAAATNNISVWAGFIASSTDIGSIVPGSGISSDSTYLVFTAGA